MKQVLAAIVLVAVLVGISDAQVGFGVKGGVNFANVGGADVTISPNSLTGFAGGLYAEISVPMLFTIQPEVLYSMKGYKVESSATILGTTYSMKGTVSLNYLEIPVLVKYTLPVPVLQPSLFAGPSMGILLNAKTKVEVTGQPTQEADIKDVTTSTDWGLVLGASAHIAVLTVDVRYDLGLTGLDKNSSAKIYNRVWSIMVGVPL